MHKVAKCIEIFTCLLTLSSASCFMIGSKLSSPSLSPSILQTTTEKSTSTSTSTDSITTTNNNKQQSSPDIKAYASGFSTLKSDVTYRKYKPSHGKIPTDLQGTYYRIGPAMFTSGSLINDKNKEIINDGDDLEEDRMVKHPFDGDGAILALTFHKDNSDEEDYEDGDSDVVTMRYRYVRTVGFKSENRKRRKIYNGMESTRINAPKDVLMNDYPIPLSRHHLQPGVNKQRKNTSNTRPIFWCNKLFTTWEGGLPYKLDHIALGTEGKSQFGGILKRDTPLGNNARYDPIKQRMIFYANKNNDAKSAEITLYEFNSNFQLEFEKRVKLTSGFMMVNDFVLTKDYAIFIQPAITVNGMQFMLSKEPGKTLSLDNRGTSYAHLIPRDESSPPITIPLPNDQPISFANMQFANAYQEQNNIIIDFIASSNDQLANSSNKKESSTSWPWLNDLASFQQKTTKKSLWRLNISNNNKVESLSCLTNKQVSFPTIKPQDNTQNYKYIYMNVGSLNDNIAPPQGILKYNVETKSIDDEWLPNNNYEFCGEPMLCPKTSNDNNGNDDGYLLTILYNGKTKLSSILLFESNNISNGPITIIPISDQDNDNNSDPKSSTSNFTVPHGYHGLFTSNVLFSTKEIERRCKLTEKMEKRSNMWNEVKSDFSGLGLRLDDEDFDLEEFLTG